MSEPPKFSFTSSASKDSTAPSGGLFGGGGTTSNTSGSGLFGQSTGDKPSLFGNNASNTSGTSGNLFGNTNTNAGSSSTGAQSSTPFGGAAAPSGGFSFGTGTGTSSSLFGGGNSSSSGTATGASTTGFSGNFNFGSTSSADQSKSAESTTQPAAPSSGLFGASAQPSAGSGLFGNNSNTATASGTSLFGNNAGTAAKSDTPSTTPAANKSTNIELSTTPAGNPPQPTPGVGLFGAKPTAGLFGDKSDNQSSSTAQAAPSGGLFGGAKPSGDQSGGSLFGANASTGQPTSNLFGNLSKPGEAPSADTSKDNAKTSAAAPTGGSLFGGLGQPKTTGDATAAKPSLFALGKPAETNSQASTAPAGSKAAPGGLFGAAPKADAPAAGTGTASSGGLFGQNKPTGESTKPAAGGLFGGATQSGEAAPAASNSGAAATGTTTTGGLFGNKAATSTAPSNANPAAAASNLFGGAAKPADAAKKTETAPAANASTTNALGASTSGPAPSSASRLAAKSLDEILTLWTTSLTAHQKSFGNMATKVSAWDRQLVENSDKISKLYARTFQAERDTAEVERQLTAVEGEQQELERYLDHYEKLVDELLARNGTPEGGVDGERERTYQLAEKCSSRLTTMSHDLTSMIEEINAASTNLRQSNKSTNQQDPLGQIVRVLNGHLAQLQQIDVGAAALQSKVAAAQKEVRSFGRNNVLGAEDMDAFARSYLGGR